MVSLVTAATTLPVFLVILPAGALADIVDRRRFLLITQGWMVVASGALGMLTLPLRHALDALAFYLHPGPGRGHERSRPGRPSRRKLFPENHAPAVALNSVGFNLARAVGPALGGLVIAAAGSGWPSC